MTLNQAHIDRAKATDLTASQMRIWSGQMLEPDKPLYNMAFSFEIEGAIDPDLFKQAFQHLVNSQDVLRLVISIIGEVPKQHFLPQLESPLEYYDYAERQNPQAEVEQWIDEARQRLFDTKELLYHTALFKLADDKYLWYLNQHHLITDGWSYTVLYQALTKHYQRLESEEQTTIKGTGSYEQYATNHGFFNQVETGSYWKEKRSTLSSPPALYGGKAVKSTSQSRRVSLNLGKERTARLKALCLDPDLRAWTVEMAMNNLFLALINAFIYKTSGQTSFSVGMPSHNRSTPAAKNTAGLFMELLPIAADISPTDSFLVLYQKGRDEYFEVLKSSTSNKPSVDFLKSFNVLLNFIPQQFGDFAGRAMNAQWIHPGHHDPGHHLRLQVHDFNQKDDYILHFDLNEALFSPWKSGTIADHFLQLLDAFIEDKNQPIGEIELLSQAEIELVNSWNATNEPIPEGDTLLTSFHKQVKSTPENIALVFEGTSLSYRQFDEKANQVANYLAAQGIKKGDIIGIQLTRSFELMWCLYGLLKAGAVYLPIDVNNPPERTKYLVKDASVKLLFTSNESPEVTCQVVEQKEIGGLISEYEMVTSEVEVGPDDTAYIIYTSGSTGKPKGVIGYHKGICNKLRWREERFPVNTDDVFIQKTPISFDVSLWELFWPLRTGLRLVLASPDVHKDTAQLVDLIKEQQVSIIHFVPSMLNAFLADQAVKGCATLRQVFCSGEALQKNTVDRLFDSLDCELHNLYGPTEASVEVTHWQCRPVDDSPAVPIGYTVPNTRHYVLDEKLNRLPIGTPGELFLAGVQVTKGYLNDKALTAARFVPDAFSTEAGAKMYKTGDLVRYREDGALEYLGRTDHQVKLRGFRIELGEIEAAMTRHPDVAQAVVVKVAQDEANAYLLGYYTGGLVEENQMKSLIGQHLPGYMVPAFFMYLDEFPLSASGKVDRKQLPAHTIGKTEKGVRHQPPETQLQEMIAEVWEEILQVDDIGIYARFTDLGGDSLKALVITSRIKEMLDLEVSVHLIFKHNHVAAYADHLEKRMIEIMSQEEDEQF